MTTAVARPLLREDVVTDEEAAYVHVCALCGAGSVSTLARGVRDYEYGAPGCYQWLRCNECGLVRLAPFPSDETLTLAYPSDYHGYHEPKSRLVAWHVNRRRQARARSLARLLPRDGTILDVGCGSGSLLEEVGKHGSFNLLGVEYQPEAARLARRRGINVWTGELEAADIPEQTVDLIVMEHVLEHVSDPFATLHRVHTFLKPAGLLLGETPNLRCPDMKLFGRYWGGGHAPRHLHLFTPGALTRVLVTTGFRDIDVTHPVYPAHMSLSIQNWLRRSCPTTDGLARGRTRYYPLLCSALMPVAILAAMLRCSGAIRFSARKPDER